MNWIMALSILSGLAAAAFGVMGARLEIRKDQDISDLALQGRWAARAGLFAALSTLLQAFHYFVNGAQ